MKFGNHKLTFDTATELTIASDAITVTQGNHKLQPQSGTTDDLSTINGTVDGDVGVFYAADFGTDTITIKHNVGNILCVGAADIALSNGCVYWYSNGTKIFCAGGGGAVAAGGDKYPMEARLTLETGTPVSITDQLAKTMLYLTSYKGCQVATYSGTAWSVIELTADLSLNLSGYIANKNYDIWVYNNAGTLTLDSTVWTNDITRATAITTQNGIKVKSGDTTRRYIGTIRITATTGQCEISFGLTPTSGGSGPKLYVYNEYNKVPVVFMSLESDDSWTYATATFRAKNNSVNNSFRFVNGGTSHVSASGANAEMDSSYAGSAAVGFGIDSATTRSGICVAQSAAAGYYSMGTIFANYNATPGYHYIQEIELGGATANFGGDRGAPTTWQSGASYRTEM